MATQLPPFAFVEDLADWLGEPISSQSDINRAHGALRMASALARAETGKTWTTPDTDPPTLVSPLPEALMLVTLQAAGRGYTNPDGEYSTRVDDAQISKKVDEAGIYLTASERDLLLPLAGRAHRGLSTVGTYRGDFDTTGDTLAWWVNGPDLTPDEV